MKLDAAELIGRAQVAFSLKPFVFKWLAAFKSLRLATKALKDLANAMNPLAPEEEDATMDAFQKVSTGLRTVNPGPPHTTPNLQIF